MRWTLTSSSWTTGTSALKSPTTLARAYDLIKVETSWNREESPANPSQAYELSRESQNWGEEAGGLM
jgi:hypothetical protein